MQLIIEHDLPQELVLPMGYHHVLQGIIYNCLRSVSGYGDFLHNKGYSYNDRQFRLFNFSLLEGKYRTEPGKIIFRDKVSFEVRSTEGLLLKLIKEKLETDGIRYQEQWYGNVSATLSDETVEYGQIVIKMKTPIVGYETDAETGKTYYYSPDEEQFYLSVMENFMRKYEAYTGLEVDAEIGLYPLKITQKDKYVTRYKGIYITGWFGTYALSGPRKYLDFLYQTGMGSKNAQGFGMFEILGVYEEDEEYGFY